jgi:hypothetical protein
LLSVLFAVVIAGMAVTPGTVASAQGTPTRQAIQMSMSLDCTHMTPTARTYATAHDLCPAVGSKTSPKNTVGGNCGWSSLGLHGQPNHWVTIYENAYSTLGPIVSVSWGVSLYNWSRGLSNYKGGSQGQFSASFSHTDFAWLGGSGYVTASMAGGVWLLWGAYCSFNYPTASVNA